MRDDKCIDEDDNLCDGLGRVVNKMADDKDRRTIELRHFLLFLKINDNMERKRSVGNFMTSNDG